MSIPGVSKLVYQKGPGGAGFTDPATSSGVDASWLADHPYMLMNVSTDVKDTGLFAPEFENAGVRGDGEPSMMIRYQKVRAQNRTPPPEPTDFKYLPTGAIDFRLHGEANAEVAPQLDKLLISNGDRDRTTLDPSNRDANYSFASLYAKLQTKFPGMLPRWSPHSPFIDPYAVRDEVVDTKPYRAGRPFWRYAVKRCPGQTTEKKCCVSLESSMKLPPSTDCVADPAGALCGKDNPAASIIRPGSPRPQPQTIPTNAGFPIDARMSWKVGGIHTSFVRAVPDLGSVNTDGVFADITNADHKQAIEGMLFEILHPGKIGQPSVNIQSKKSVRPKPSIANAMSPKCTRTPTGSLADAVTMFLEHFYVAISGDFERIKFSQKSRQRSWKEGWTDYVKSNSTNPRLPKANIRHVLNFAPEMESDEPTSERYAYVPGPDWAIRSGDGDRDGIPGAYYNDYDTPCTQMRISDTDFKRSLAGTSVKIAAEKSDLKFTQQTRCIYRRAGKFEWALQAMVQSYRPATKAVSDNAADNLENLSRIWYETNILSLKGTPNLLPEYWEESKNLTVYMKQSNRVLFWDVDQVFDAPAYAPPLYNSGSPVPQLADLIRLHTTAPAPGATPTHFTNYRNIRAGLAGADRVLPAMTYEHCSAYTAYLAGAAECHPCLLAGQWQASVTAANLTARVCGASTYGDATGVTGDPVKNAQLKACCTDDGVPREVTAAMIWDVWAVSKTIGSPAVPANAKKWSELTVEEMLEGLRAYPGTAPWLSTLNETVNPFRRGTSDGTPRSNVHQAICHVDPFVSTAFLIKRAVEDPSLSPCAVLDETPCGDNPKCSWVSPNCVGVCSTLSDETSCRANAECVWIPTDTDPATGSCKPKFSHFSGLSTFSAGTLWPGDSFRTNGSAEPYKSLGCPSDFCTQGDPLTEAPYNYTGSDPDFSTAPLEYIGRLDMFYQVQDMINRFGASSDTFHQDLLTNIYGGTGDQKDYTESKYSTQATPAFIFDASMSLAAGRDKGYGIHTCADQANRTFFSPSSWGSRGIFVGLKETAGCTCCQNLGLDEMETIPIVRGSFPEEWDMRWSVYRGSRGPLGDRAEPISYCLSATSPGNQLLSVVSTSDGVFKGDSFPDLDCTRTGAMASPPFEPSSGEYQSVPPSGLGMGPSAPCTSRSTSSVPVRPLYTVDLINNVRLLNNLDISGRFASTVANWPTVNTACCGNTDNCACDPLTNKNNAGEPCTRKDKNGCLTFRLERGDGAIMVGLRSARGGTSPATPPATFGGIRVPPIQQLYNADVCPRWNDVDGNGFTRARVGAATVMDPTSPSPPPADTGAWYAVASDAISIGVLDSDRLKRCYNAMEQYSNGSMTPYCTHETASTTFYPSSSAPTTMACASANDPSQAKTFRLTETFESGLFRTDYKPPYIHPTRSGSGLDQTTGCPLNKSQVGPEVRGLDQFAEMFEHSRQQEQVGRVSWGRRTFGPSAAAQADDSFILPDTQHFWTPFEPYVNGKNDGLLECANSGDQTQLVNNLLLHTVLKTADICLGNPAGTMVGDDGYTLDADRAAYYRDTYSHCVNPADAGLEFCTQLIGLEQYNAPEPEASDGTPLPPPPPSPIEICMGLFGSGRELEVAPEFAQYTSPTTSDHGRFPYSCVCTGSDGLEFPELDDDEKQTDSYNSELAGLCACGALARTARLIVGNAVVGTTETPDYENPTFSNLPASQFYTPFCSPLPPCTGTPQPTPCGSYTTANECQSSSNILSDSTYANCLWDLNSCVPWQVETYSGTYNDYVVDPYYVEDAPELDAIQRCTTKAQNPQRFCGASATGNATNPQNRQFPFLSTFTGVQFTSFKQRYSGLAGGTSLQVEDLPTTLVQRRNPMFTLDDGTVPATQVTVPMPFTAQELGDLTKCLTKRGGCAADQTSFGDALLTYPLEAEAEVSGYSRAVILPPTPTGSHCPTIGTANSDIFAELVRSAGAEFAAESALFPPGLQTLPITCRPASQNVLPANWTLYPVTDPATEGEGNPFGVYIDESAPLVAGINDVCGCLVVWTGADAETEAEQFKAAVEARGFTAPVFFGDGKTTTPMTGTTTFPMALSHAFVFGDADTADTVSRFAAGLNSCVQLYATLTEAGLPSDVFRTIMAASPCFAARAERFRVKVVDLSDVGTGMSVLGASGTCETATSGRRMFMAKLDTETAEITFPANCTSDIRYLLVSGSDTAQWPSNADSPPVVVQGVYETLGNSSCTVGGLGSRLFTAASDLDPLPFVVDKNVGGSTNFSFSGTLVQHGETPLTTPTETNPCWIDVCQAGADAFVISGAGRFPTPVPFFEPDSDSVCAPFSTTTANAFLSSTNCAYFTEGDENRGRICAAFGQRVALAGGRTLSDWNNPTTALGAANRALVTAAPLVASCHQGIVRKLPPQPRGSEPPTVAWGKPCALTVHSQTLAAESAADSSTDLWTLTEYGLFPSTSISHTRPPGLNNGTAVVPLRQYRDLPPGLPLAEAQQYTWYAGTFVTPANRPTNISGATADACRPFLDQTTPGNTPVAGKWLECVGALHFLAVAVPPEAWAQWGTVVVDAAGAVAPTAAGAFQATGLPPLCSRAGDADNQMLLKNAHAPVTAVGASGLLETIELEAQPGPGAGPQCIAECRKTLGCVTAVFYHTGASTNGGTCRLYNDDLRTVVFAVEKPIVVVPGPVGASEDPPSTEPWIAVCVEPVSPVDPHPSGFGGAAAAAATAGAPGVLFEPCPSDGTALSLNADSTTVCAPTACDVDGPGATEVPIAMHALLAATRGSCSGQNVEKSGLLPLDSVATTSSGGDSVVWARPASDADADTDADTDDTDTAPPPPPAPPATANVYKTHITIEPNPAATSTATGVKYTFTAEWTPPANTAAFMANAAGATLKTLNLDAAMPSVAIYRKDCDPPPAPDELYPGHVQFTGNYNTANQACNPCTQSEIS